MKIEIEATKSTPSVFIDFSRGLFEFKGRSIPEDPREFYDPILKTIEVYGEQAQEVTLVNIALNYFNTSSSKYILRLLASFSNLNKRVSKVKVNWYYDTSDEDLLETANDIESSCGLKFSYIGIDPQ